MGLDEHARAVDEIERERVGEVPAAYSMGTRNRPDDVGHPFVQRRVHLSPRTVRAGILPC